MAAMVVAGMVTYIWRSGRTGGAYVDPALDAQAMDLWRQQCIERARNAVNWLDKVNHATTPIEVAACLDADAKFVRIYATRKLGWAPDDLNLPYWKAEVRNDFAQRRDLKTRIQEYAKTVDPAKHWYQPDYWRIDSHIRDLTLAYDEVNALETVEILLGYVETEWEAGKDESWELRLVNLAQIFDGREIRQGDPGSPFARLVATKKPDECKVLIVPFREWLFRNLRYCYFHPEEKHLKLDNEARAKGIPSKEYRKSHPWGGNEGPNKTDPQRVPGKNLNW